jgi:hypothetical protein
MHSNIQRYFKNIVSKVIEIYEGRKTCIHNGNPFLSVPLTTIPILSKKSSGNGN